jgi:hypothetical protein
LAISALDPSAKGRIAFGLPLAPGAMKKIEELEIIDGGKRLDGVRMRPLVFDFAPNGTKRGLRSVLVELPPSTRLPISIEPRCGDRARGPAPQPAVGGLGASFRKVSVSVKTATYGVEPRGTSTFAAVPRDSRSATLFESVQPPVIASFPPGYLAHTPPLRDLVARDDVLRRPELAKMRFLSDAFDNFADVAMGATG